MMDIQVFHAYNRLSDDGFVKPLTCHHCDAKLVSRIDAEDKPYLYCAFCNIESYPGLALYGNILAVVKEHSA